MTKEMIDWIETNLNSHNFYDIKESELDYNIVYLVWKKTDKIFATLYKDKIKEAMEEEKK